MGKGGFRGNLKTMKEREGATGKESSLQCRAYFEKLYGVVSNWVFYCIIGGLVVSHQRHFVLYTLSSGYLCF